jgi:hypothetical protein
MKRYMILVGASTLITMLLGCTTLTDVGDSHQVTGSGRLSTESRSVQDFSGISLSGVGRLVIEQTGQETLTITAEDNIMPFLVSEVHHGKLVLGTESNVSISPTREIVYRLTVRDLECIEISGAGAVEALGIDTPFLGVTLSGAASVYVEGWAERQEVVISGAGSYQAINLESIDVTVLDPSLGTHTAQPQIEATRCDALTRRCLPLDRGGHRVAGTGMNNRPSRVPP